MRAEKPRSTPVKKHRWEFHDHCLWDFPHVLNLKNCYSCRAAVNVLFGFEPGLSSVLSLILRHLFVISGVSRAQGTVIICPRSLVCAPVPPNNKPQLNQIVLNYNLWPKFSLQIIFLLLFQTKRLINSSLVHCTQFVLMQQPPFFLWGQTERASQTWAPFTAETEEIGLLSQT